MDSNSGSDIYQLSGLNLSFLVCKMKKRIPPLSQIYTYDTHLQKGFLEDEFHFRKGDITNAFKGTVSSRGDLRDFCLGIFKLRSPKVYLFLLAASTSRRYPWATLSMHSLFNISSINNTWGIFKCFQRNMVFSSSGHTSSTSEIATQQTMNTFSWKFIREVQCSNSLKFSHS